MFPAQIAKKTVHSPLNGLVKDLVQIHLTTREFISGLCPIPLVYTLSLCQYHTILKQISVSLSASFFKVALINLHSLKFHTNFRLSFSISVKKSLRF